MNSEYILKLILKNLRKHKGNRRTDRFEIHATDLYNSCLRMICLAYKQRISIHSFQKKFPDKTYLTFKIGEAVEEVIRELVEGEKPKPLILKLRDIYIIGSPDIVIPYKDGQIILECKSIKKDYYDKLREPLPQHQEQVQVYLWLAKKFSHRNYKDYAFIIYVPKQETEPVVKIFPIKFNQGYADKFESIINKLRTFLRTGKLPARICPNEKAGMKYECPFVKICFKEE